METVNSPLRERRIWISWSSEVPKRLYPNPIRTKKGDITTREKLLRSVRFDFFRARFPPTSSVPHPHSTREVENKLHGVQSLIILQLWKITSSVSKQAKMNTTSVFQISHKSVAIGDCLELAMKINASGVSSPTSKQEDCFGSVCSSSLPPLDLVTTCSEDCSDDVSSVSSCSINEDPDNDFPLHRSHSCSPSTPRSIFKRYWGSQDQSHKLHRPLPTEISAQIIRSLTAEDESPTQNVYEETLREREEDARLGLSPKRRSIFNNHYKSNSTPSFRTQKYFDLRKIQSSSALGRKPATSCLRPSRYSGASSNDNNDLRLSQRTSRSDNSVHFSEKVEITVFQPSLERYAQEGWSDFFAYR